MGMFLRRGFVLQGLATFSDKEMKATMKKFLKG